MINIPYALSALTSYDIQMPLDRTLLVQLDWEIESNEEKQGIFFLSAWRMKISLQWSTIVRNWEKKAKS